MNFNEIKKSLYKENPKARCIVADNSGISYEASLQSGQVIYFTIPFNDFGDAKFYPEMDGKLLIRWINK
jgi:hypothetical protein